MKKKADDRKRPKNQASTGKTKEEKIAELFGKKFQQTFSPGSFPSSKPAGKGKKQEAEALDETEEAFRKTMEEMQQLMQPATQNFLEKAFSDSPDTDEFDEKMEAEFDRKIKKLAASLPDQASLEAVHAQREKELADADPRYAVEQLVEKRWGELKYENLFPEERDFIRVRWLRWEVNDGGLDQYFHNETGDQAPETLDALKRLGAKKTAKAFEKAMALVGTPYPADGEKRRELSAERQEAAEQALENIEFDETNFEQAFQSAMTTEFDKKMDRCDKELDKAEEPFTDLALDVVIATYRKNGIALPPGI